MMEHHRRVTFSDAMRHHVTSSCVTESHDSTTCALPSALRSC
jgi:hypothetical protein